MNILLTGASGFIGRYLLKELKRNNKYNIVLLTKEPIEGYKCILHNDYKFDIEEFYKEGINEIDYLIHLGAFIPKSSLEADDYEKCNLNIYNTEYLINNIPVIKRKIIYISSVDVYGKCKDIINEETVPLPETMYAMSKLYCEKMLSKFCKDKGISLNILRLGHIYGIGEEKYKKFIPSIINSINKQCQIDIYTDGTELRSFLHVKDCCKFINNCIGLNSDISIINVISNRAVMIKDVAEIMASFSNKQIKINILDDYASDVSYIFDNKKCKKYLGEEKISLEEGLKDEYMNSKR